MYSRILLTRMKFIGDVVLTTPIIASVRKAFPDAFIAYLAEKNAASLLEHNPALDEIIPFDFARPTILEQSRVAVLLHRRNFDLVIDLFGNPRSALLAFLSRAPTRIGPARKGRGTLYTVQVRDDGTPKTAIEFHNQYLTAAGIPTAENKTAIVLSPDELREARIFLQWFDRDNSPLDLQRPIIGIHPGATWPAKKWLPEYFGHLADRLKATLGAQIVITAGPGEEDVVRDVLSHSIADVKVLRALPLRQLAAVIAICRVFVANDAGPMHIAAAVGTPTIGLFGPGEEEIWFPYSSGDGHRPLRKNVPCHPCHLDVCNRAGDGYMECMKLLSVDEVFHAVEQAFRLKAQ
jgi:lipopolysaccharide heptosyltransferase II